MNPYFPILTTAFVFGLTAGISPGPLLTLVVSESLRSGVRAGIAVAIAPLLTDAVIITFAIVAVGLAHSIDVMVGILFFTGAIYLGYLAFESLKFQGLNLNTEQRATQSLQRGVITNFLSPAPYIFWFTVGTSTIIQAKAISWMAVALFIAIFYILLVGIKTLLAVLVGRNRQFLASHYYVWIVRILGLVLAAFALYYLLSGIKVFTTG